MDRSAVKAIVGRELGPMCERLGLGHWAIRVSYDLRLDVDSGRVPGQCHRLYDYEKVTIEFDPDGLDDEAEVLRVLRHELLHLVASPFDLYGDAVEKLTLDESTKDVLHRVWNHAQEMTVVNLERLVRNLTDEPDEAPAKPAVDPPAVP